MVATRPRRLTQGTAREPITLVAGGALPDPHRPGRGENLASLRSIASRSIAGVDRDLLTGWDRVVVTGGTGCIGTATLHLLRETGASQLFSIADQGPARYGPVPGVHYVYGDITDRAHIEALLHQIRPELVVHLAGIRDPGLAEQKVADAIRVNVVGTTNVLQAAVAAGVLVAVAASTGKAMRLFTSDIYASSKHLLEHAVAKAAADAGGGLRTGAARFTHIVDNSLIHGKLEAWAASGSPILLHGSGVDLYAQSAREAAELLLLTARLVHENPERSWVTAIRDLGWPPIELLGLAQDVVEETGSCSPILEVGFPPGYEERAYEGTVDPLTAGDISPLMNALEAAQTFRPRYCPDSIDACPLPGASGDVEASVRTLEENSDCEEDTVRARLVDACLAYLQHKLSCAPLEAVVSIGKRGASGRLLSGDHRMIHDLVAGHLDSVHLLRTRPGRVAALLP